VQETIANEQAMTPGENLLPLDLIMSYILSLLQKKNEELKECTR